MALNMSYTDKQTILQIADQELQELQELEGLGGPPEVLVTSNPFKCLRDTSLDIAYHKDRNLLQVCKNWIQSERDLRSALAREKTWIRGSRPERGMSNDEEMRLVIQACKAEFSFYPHLDEALRAEGTKLCAKVHSKRKLTNRADRNVDTWHFYTRQLVEDNWYVY